MNRTCSVLWVVIPTIVPAVLSQPVWIESWRSSPHTWPMDPLQLYCIICRVECPLLVDVVAHRSVSGQQYAGVAKSVLHIPYIYATCTSHDYIICIFYTAKYIQYAWNIIRNCVYKASTVNILVFIAVLALYLPEFLGLRFFVSRQATFQDLDLSGPWSVDLASWIRKKQNDQKVQASDTFWEASNAFL